MLFSWHLEWLRWGRENNICSRIDGFAHIEAEDVKHEQENIDVQTDRVKWKQCQTLTKQHNYTRAGGQSACPFPSHFAWNQCQRKHTHTHEHTHTYSGKEWNFHHQNDTITSIVFHTFPLAHSMIIFPNRRHKSKCSESERNLSWTQLENFYQQIHNQHHHLLIVFINLPTNWTQ